MFATAWTRPFLVISTLITMTHGQYFRICALGGYVQQRLAFAVETLSLYGWLQLGAAEGPGLMAW